MKVLLSEKAMPPALYPVFGVSCGGGDSPVLVLGGGYPSWCWPGEGRGRRRASPVLRPDWSTPSPSSHPSKDQERVPPPFLPRTRTGVPPWKDLGQETRGTPLKGPGMRDQEPVVQGTPSPCCQTHTCENSTFSILRMQTVIKGKFPKFDTHVSDTVTVLCSTDSLPRSLTRIDGA